MVIGARASIILAARAASVIVPFSCGFGSSMISNGASKKIVIRHFASLGTLRLCFHCLNVAGLNPSASAAFSNSDRLKQSIEDLQK